MVDYVEGLADDQMVDQFGILFPQGIPGGGNGDLLRLRMDQAFDEPELVAATYEVNFEGIKIPKTGSEDTTKEFTMSFRIDGNWQVYYALRKWHQLVINNISGSLQGEADTRTTMILNAYGAPNKTIKYSKRFNGVKIKSFKVTAWDYNNKAEPSRIEAGFIFINTDELTMQINA